MSGVPAPPLRGVQPVAGALEGIARKRNPPSGFPCEQSLEANREARLIGLRDGLNESARTRRRRLIDRRRLQARQHTRCGCVGGFGPGGQRHGRQHRAWTDLDYQVHSQFRQRSDSAGEGHRPPGVPPPIFSVERLVRIHCTACQVAHHGERRPGELHAVERRFKRVQDRLDQGTVKRLGRIQARNPQPLRLQLSRDRLDRRRRAADHLVRAVVGGNVQADRFRTRVPGFDGRLNPFRRREDRGHGTRLHAGHQRSPRARESHSVFQAEHAGRLSRGDLPDAMPHHHRRPHADTCPERRECAFQSVKSRLLPGGVAQIAIVLSGPAEHHVQQRSAPFVPEDGLAAVHDRSCDGFVLVERVSHARPLAALPGVCERHPGRGGLGTWLTGRFRHRFQTLSQRPHVVEDNPRTMVEMASPHARGPRHVRQQRMGSPATRIEFARPFVQPGQVAPRQFLQSGAHLARQRQEAARPLRDSSCRTGCGSHMRRSLRGPVLLHKEVCVRPGDPEAVDPRQPWPSGAVRPVHHGRGHPQRHPFPIELRVGIMEVQVLRYHPALHHERRLYQSGNPRGRFQVSDVGLYRADQDRAVGRAFPAVDVGHGVQLDRVSDRRSRPVCFEVVDLRRCHARLYKRFRHHLLKRRGIGDRQPHTGSAVVHYRTADDCPDRVAVGLRITQALEDHHAATLAPHVTVRRCVERLAPSVGRQHHRVRAQFVDAAVEDGLHAPRNGQIGLALLQVRHGVVDCHHRRRTSRVHGLRRPRQPEHERDPSGRAVQVGAAERVEARRSLGRLGRFHDQHAILVVADPGVDTGATAFQPVGIDARVLEGLPAHFQHHALLRVQELGLDR